jgi:hypothetical protein
MGGAVARFDVVRLSLVMDEESFAVMFEAVEPRLRRALVAWYGPLVGKEAAADALSCRMAGRTPALGSESGTQ